jgi:rfaE bifunctional protein nucleotidyltransferase chain/domain
MLENERAQGKRVVLCHGVFDLLHPGHIRHLHAAKHEGDILVVTVTPDRFVRKGPGRPVFPEQLRAESLAALAVVDFVAINEWPTAVETIRLLRPQVYAKGEEYEKPEDDVTGKIAEEEAAVRSVGGQLHCTHEITFSSSKLLNDHFDVLSPEAKRHVSALRGKYSAKDVINMIQSLKSLSVLVIGDAIVDEYHSCKALGRASKTTSINARFLEAEEYAGGALAVANHLAGVCGSVQLLTCLGEQDSRRSFIESHLHPSITPTLLLRPDGPTTVKRRYIDPFRYQKMFEVTFIQDQPLPASVSADLERVLREKISSFDLVVVADFGHGLIGPQTIDLLAKQAKFLAISAQTNSTNMGYNPVTRYPRADYLCVDQEEIRFAYHDRYGSLEPIIAHAFKDFSASTVAITQGDCGSLVSRRGGDAVQTPVFTQDVIDTIGAGDAFFSFTAPCATLGFPPEIVGLIGNAAGAIKSHILGNKEPVNVTELCKFVTTLLK